VFQNTMKSIPCTILSLNKYT